MSVIVFISLNAKFGFRDVRAKSEQKIVLVTDLYPVRERERERQPKDDTIGTKTGCHRQQIQQSDINSSQLGLARRPRDATVAASELSVAMTTASE